MMNKSRTLSFLEAGMAGIVDSPCDEGKVELIVVRPSKNKRLTPDHCRLTLKGGVEGDHWAKGCWKSLPDGSPDPSVQIALMNSRCLDLISTSKSQWPLAGDNVIVDLNLSVNNLIPGQKLSIGTAILEVTDVPHTGCIKFRDRFGIDALKFISTNQAKELRLRGVYARVIKDGDIQIGDLIKKIME